MKQKLITKKHSFTFYIVIILSMVFSSHTYGQEWGRKFEQLGTLLPTPNAYRAGSGAPGKDYYTQKADYDIKITLDDKKQTITGTEKITYTNNSPEMLNYVWIQLDQNVRASDSNTHLVRARPYKSNKIKAIIMDKNHSRLQFDGGFKITKVLDDAGKPLSYTINKTMMRIDLPKPLKTKGSTSFQIGWWYNVNDRFILGGRSGYEYFPEDKNYLYTIAQFYPRMAAYTDKQGWQNKQFLGRGEFALTFGDYKVDITLPSDFIVAATGEIKNINEVLTPTQKKRFEQAKNTYDKPVLIVTEEEAVLNEAKRKSTKTKTWKFHANNVRDFAFATSRKFIWDAQAVKINGSKNSPLAMSFYPKEGNPLWEKESTKAVKRTLEAYSEFTFPYPYPVAISVHTASIGMEYPMICFNYGRPKKDGTYSDRVKYGMIGVIIHEVGHNFFPMLVNSDERQWTWMDEGLNTFLQYRTEQVKYTDFPSAYGTTKHIINYMKGDKSNISPIMTNSEQIKQFGYNAYAKPATALNILREAVMGPELFDKAFKTYAQRWVYKSPEPADFFRTMEDASAVDLDWFWRGWFFSTDHVDINLSSVKRFIVSSDADAKESVNLSNDKIPTEKIAVVDTPDSFYGEFKSRLNDNEIKKKYEGTNLYELTFKNVGGLVMPIIIKWVYTDGTTETRVLPAEIWRLNEEKVVKIFLKNKVVKEVIIDEDNKTADVEFQNNTFPRVDIKSDFDKFKNKEKK